MCCLLSQKTCAEFLGVSLRTVHNWDTGQRRVPWSAVRLMRLLRQGDLGALHDSWEGFKMIRGKLFTPDGRGFLQEDMRRWWMTVEHAYLFLKRYEAETRGVGAVAPARPAAVELVTSPPVEAEVLVAQPVSSIELTAYPAGQPTAFLSFGLPVAVGVRAAGSASPEAAPPPATANLPGALQGFLQAVERLRLEASGGDVNMMANWPHITALSATTGEASMAGETALRCALQPDATPSGLIPSANRGSKFLNRGESGSSLTSPPKGER